MVKKLNRILNIAMGTFTVVFIGHGIEVFYDYRKYPNLYAMRSAPWYTSILIHGIFTLICLMVLAVIKLMIRKNIKVETDDPS